MIITETYNLIKSKHPDILENLKIADIRIGVFLTAVILSDGSCGVASTNIDTHSNCYIKDRNFGEFSPAKITGQKIIDLFERYSGLKIINTLKVAVLNAVSSKIISSPGYKILYNVDPVDLIDLTTPQTVTIVGAFQSYIKKISSTKNKLYVLELDENALNEEQKQFYVPANEYSKILPTSNVVIITGLSLVNNTLDDLLKYTSSKALIIITGPSSSLIPDILFQKNVKYVGATKITNPKLLLNVVSEAGTGFHLFKYCAEKYCIVNE